MSDDDEQRPPARGSDGLPYQSWWPPPESTLQAPGPAQGPPPPLPPLPANLRPQPQRSGPLTSAALVVVGALVVLGGVAFVGLRLLDRGPSHPDEWDTRVLAIADWVARERGLGFDHPVYVDFLSPEEYAEVTRSSTQDLTDEAREEFAQGAGSMRALGLASGDIDLAEAAGDMADEGTLAFYDPEDERVRVRGDSLTPALRVTIAHELVHVLQDQHFDLERIGDDDESAAGEALRALAEGDAGRIEDRYRAEALDAAEQAEADEATEGDVGPDGEEPLAGVPDAMVALFAAPYALGEPFVAALDADGGNLAIDEAFRDPPQSEEHIFDILRYLDGDAPLDVEPIEVDEGKVLDDGELGIVSWYLILAARIDPDLALAAADGWGGDAYAFIERGGNVCVEARFVGDTTTDTDEMFTALETWRGEMPPGSRVERDGDGVVLYACDPGPNIDIGPETSPLDALQLPTVRAHLVASVLSVADERFAACFADRVLDGITVAQLADPPPGFVESEIPRRQQAAVNACRPG
jgi:hypothetical protein